MDVVLNVAQGFGVALQPINLLYCFIGVFIGPVLLAVGYALIDEWSQEIIA